MAGATPVPARNQKIHVMRFSSNSLASVASSAVNNDVATRTFAYLEAEGIGFVACSAQSVMPVTDRRCSGDRYFAAGSLPTSPGFNPF